jgi:hypothetical protein
MIISSNALKVTLTYGEVMQLADDKDIFEIVSSPVDRYIGMRVQIKKTRVSEGFGAIMKNIGTYHDDGASTIVIPYGAITGAHFRRVDVYTEIDIRDALTHLKNRDKDVYLEDNGHYTKLEKYDSLRDLDFYDFDDLLLQKYYIEGE